MNPEQKRKINNNRSMLIENLDFDDIKGYLFSNLSSFREKDICKIESEKTRDDKVRMLLEILLNKKSPSNIFQVFCDSLRKVKTKFHEALADQIENTDTDTSSLHPKDFNGDDLTDTNIDNLTDTNIDASIVVKVVELNKNNQEQTKILLQILHKVSNFDHTHKPIKEELEKIPQFKQLSNGQSMVNENIENFSNFISNRLDSRTVSNPGLVLRLKTNKKPKNDDFTEIACRMGEHIFTACADSCSSEFINYSTAMQKLLENQTPEFKEDIKETAKSLHFLEMVGYQTVDSIAKELFDVCNWGRILTWFAFWKQLAEDFEGSLEEEKLFGSYIGFHIARNPLCRKWIEINGGWEWVLNNGDKAWYKKLFG